jgi:hypothetical protein
MQKHTQSYNFVLDWELGLSYNLLWGKRKGGKAYLGLVAWGKLWGFWGLIF